MAFLIYLFFQNKIIKYGLGCKTQSDLVAYLLILDYFKKEKRGTLWLPLLIWLYCNALLLALLVFHK